MRELSAAFRFILMLPALWLAVVVPVHGQSPEITTIEAAKARLVSAVLENSTWPDEAALEAFVVGLYGDDRELLAALQREMTGKVVRDKPVRVASFPSLDTAADSQILLLARAENERLADIRLRLLGSATLMVSDQAEDTANIMVNFTYPSPDRVAFEISASNMIQAGLNPSRAVLMFGGDKSDLADVYDEAEQRLQRALALAEEQQQRLTAQTATIAAQQEAMAANRAELQAFESQLAGVQNLLEDSVAQLGANAQELQDTEQVLAEKEASIASYSERIEENRQRLEAQERSLRERERQIAEQSSILVTQLSTIESQRLFLIVTATGFTLVLFLIALVFRAYRSKDRIAGELAAKTGELEVANEKLLEVTEAKSLFLSTMSHEIRTPMNGVIGMAELLEGTSLTAQQGEYVGLILKSADTLLGLINDILDFSKIEAGHLELEEIPFNVREVLGDTLQTLALRANEKGLELTFHIPPEVPERIVGDPLRLRQIMVNLVGNAIKFTDEGEVAVDLSLVSQSDQVQLLFEVRDTGIGISEAQQQKIFEAFGQADSSTTRQFGGTGLGLSIAVQLVQMMGGNLDVRSAIGDGSTFYFTADFALPEGPQPIALQPEELRGLRALVVDDNETNRMILDELLSNWGMSVTCVTGGQEALDELASDGNRDTPYAIALLDVMMPHMDGFQLAQKIREQSSLAQMRILMLTSAGRTNTEQERRRLDISRVLLKPTKHSALQSAIADALGVAGPEESSADLSAAEEVVARRVLLVEDNPVNRRVATEVLGRRGHSVEVAGNGREAVEASSQQDFDVILMDVHMPVMDGLTATRIIREAEHGGGRHTPIIALTAGATVEDRENCMYAGMDSFVSKPFRAEELIGAVEAAAEGTPISEPRDAVATGASTLSSGDEPSLDWQAALRNLEGDDEFLRELCEMFLTQYPAMLTTIKEAVDANASDELQRAAHALKGSSQVIGGKAVAARALDLEQLGRAGDARNAGPVFAALVSEAQLLHEALLAAMPGH